MDSQDSTFAIQTKSMTGVKVQIIVASKTFFQVQTKVCSTEFTISFEKNAENEFRVKSIDLHSEDDILVYRPESSGFYYTLNRFTQNHINLGVALGKAYASAIQQNTLVEFVKELTTENVETFPQKLIKYYA